MVSVYWGHDYRDIRIWIVGMRFFQSPTATQMISSAVVKQIAIFTKLTVPA